MLMIMNTFGDKVQEKAVLFSSWLFALQAPASFKALIPSKQTPVQSQRNNVRAKFFGRYVLPLFCGL